MENKKKREKLFGVFLCVVIVAVGAGMFIYNRLIGDMAPKVVINGVELSTDATVQEIVDAGFQIGLSSVGEAGLDIDKQMQIPGESYTSERYYIYVQNDYGLWECTDVSFSVYNASVNSVDFAKSKIYSYKYYTAGTAGTCKVTINGVDFKGMNQEEAVSAFEEAGISFGADDKEDFLTGELPSLYGKPKTYSYILTQDYEKINLEWVEVRKKV